MATYKVIQDIEAEDKLLGPLSLKQFLFAVFTVVCLYISVTIVRKGAGPVALLFIFPAIISGFLAFPWGRDQTTEVWLLAKLRFYVKPRRRIWDQNGIQQLVTINVPKKVNTHLTKELTQSEVRSRLKILADTIDSRGWAVKNSAVSLSASPAYMQQVSISSGDSDRLVGPAVLPHDVPVIDVQANDDILDEVNNPTARKLKEMQQISDQLHRDQAMQQLQAVRQGPSPQPNWQQNKTGAKDVWFMQPQPVATGYATFNSRLIDPKTAAVGKSGKPAQITSDEAALLDKIHYQKEHQFVPDSHLKTISPLTKDAASPVGILPKRARVIPGQTKITTPGTATSSTITATVTSPARPAIINLASRNDLTVATLARQAKTSTDSEVVVPLH